MAASMLASKMTISSNILRICRSKSNIVRSLRHKHTPSFTSQTRLTQRLQCQKYVFPAGHLSSTHSGLHSGLHTSCMHAAKVKTPGFPESVSEGDIRWDKEEGESVKEDDVIGEIETDKVSIPVPSPCAGTIKALLVADGDKVTPGMDIAEIEEGEGGSSEPAKSEEPAKEEPAKQEEKKEESKSESSSEKGSIPSSAPAAPSVPSSPQSSKPTSEAKATPAKATPVKSDSSSSSAPAPGSRGESRVKMNRMRLRIAQRLKEAQNTCAMLTTFNEIDMSNIMEMRKTFKEGFQKKHGIKLGFMSAFIKASAYALQDQPSVNAVIDENEIVYRDYVDVSIAVATPKGLVVPVLRDCETMNYAQIESGLVALGEKAKSGNLAIEDMDGGTFTISNGGVFGSMFGTPIINPPQSAILGMHGVFDRPVAINGKVEVRPMMYVALTYDHRLVDGREAVTFLRKVKSAVEDPRVLLLDL